MEGKFSAERNGNNAEFFKAQIVFKINKFILVEIVTV